MLISSRQGLECSPAQQPNLPVDPATCPTYQAKAHHCVLGAFLLIYTGLSERRGGGHGPSSCPASREGKRMLTGEGLTASHPKTMAHAEDSVHGQAGGSGR